MSTSVETSFFLGASAHSNPLPLSSRPSLQRSEAGRTPTPDAVCPHARTAVALRAGRKQANSSFLPRLRWQKMTSFLDLSKRYAPCLRPGVWSEEGTYRAASPSTTSAVKGQGGYRGASTVCEARTSVREKGCVHRGPLGRDAEGKPRPAILTPRGPMMPLVSTKRRGDRGKWC